MEEGEGRLDEPGDARGRHGVADHGGDGAQEAMAVARRVGRRHACARSSARSAAGTPRPWPSTRATVPGSMPDESIGAADGAGMSAGARRGQALAATVAGDADALDEGVDSIAIALGVAAALENHDAGSFAGEHAVCAAAEGPGGSRAREGVELAEDEREIDVGLEVDAAGDRQIGPPLDSALIARSSATSDEALAASTTKLAPERSNRCASRPAVALVSWPGMVAASNGGRLERRSSAIASRSAGDQSG